MAREDAVAVLEDDRALDAALERFDALSQQSKRPPLARILENDRVFTKIHEIKQAAGRDVPWAAVAENLHKAGILREKVQGRSLANEYCKAKQARSCRGQLEIDTEQRAASPAKKPSKPARPAAAPPPALTADERPPKPQASKATPTVPLPAAKPSSTVANEAVAIYAKAVNAPRTKKEIVQLTKERALAGLDDSLPVAPAGQETPIKDAWGGAEPVPLLGEDFEIPTDTLAAAEEDSHPALPE